ncbi:glycosyltransferase family 4 protein [Paraburkholderia phytofirmans]|uniref:Glycosyl transferase group 1 n=2 Tax=Paraburkholderia phytofirmans TaxID=261302 RepID=B2T0H2_PARPJ|nr:glycosyltransferase family 4 protein [Paraburkholderia phytofirmans]ACD15277.1 glycosyl transferase group 1 [Paraburkholderia phytofirmans PsJN]
MERCRVLMINDFSDRGGAEIVYRQSVGLFRTLSGVEVESFDNSQFVEQTSLVSRAWNHAAAQALEKTILRFRPHRVLVHNYHNALSPSVLGVIARHKRSVGYRTYHTCHDYHLVYWNPALQFFKSGLPQILPLDALSTFAALRLRSSPKGFMHDLLTKTYWHAVRAACRPSRVFDQILCPSAYMQEALNRCGITNTVILHNPSSVPTARIASPKRGKERFNLAFAGRLAQEKGLRQFIELAQAADFEHIESIGAYGEGPERAVIEQRFPALIKQGKLIFFGSLSQERLFTEMQCFADAVIVPSVCAENAPLIVIEAAMLGLPALVRDGGSMATTADAVGNKIKFSTSPDGLKKALAQLSAHLSNPERRYQISEYLPEYYTERLAAIMGIRDELPLASRHEFAVRRA